jgi:hypothetical protein
VFFFYFSRTKFATALAFASAAFALAIPKVKPTESFVSVMTSPVSGKVVSS